MLIYMHYLCIFKPLMPVAPTPDYDPISGHPTLYDDSVHTERTRQMATINKLPSGAYRVQIRRKGRYASETFLRRDDAHRWARQAETRVDQGLAPNKSSVSRLTTFGDLVDLHIADMCAVGKPPLRSKAATLAALRAQLGDSKIGHLDRQVLIDFGRRRAAMGAGPVTLGIDIGTIRMILTHAAAVHGLDISPEPVDLARVALKRLGLVGKGKERDRRPTQDELIRLARFFESIERLTIPMTRIVEFAVATAMRLDEICRVEWKDLDPEKRMLLIRDRKDPRNKDGNDQRIPLFSATGYDAWAIVCAQAPMSGKNGGRVFPHNPRSVGTAFRRACRALEIEDLHFHDLRHEGTSRLFEAGFAIEQVALVTGHKDWKMLRRYTHLKPDDLHSLAASKSLGPAFRLAAE
jgi:integrase